MQGKARKSLARLNRRSMYQPKFHQLSFETFHLPFGGKLDPNNRWVKLAEAIPWHVAEELYATKFPSKRGAPALTVRMALESLIIKEKLGLSDVETVEQIRENPYLQYFLGLERYHYEAPFDASSMTHFRKRCKHADLAALQEDLLRRQQEKEKAKQSNRHDDDDEPGGSPSNKGRLIVDATCAPADIAYPTDIGLLNDAREKSEQLIDKLYEHAPEGMKKPRTYRQQARKDFLAVSMKRGISKRKLQWGIRKQLQYLGRNLKSIGKLSATLCLTVLEARWYRTLLVISELYRQQLEMYRTNRKSIAERLVSISQPHVRPIVRGKASARTEFGMKLCVSSEGWRIQQETVLPG